MVYQKSFRPIAHLAEAAGIKKALEDCMNYSDISGLCEYCCATRRKATGELLAVVGGAFQLVQCVGVYDVEFGRPYGEDYSDYYEDLPESLVELAADEWPDLVEREYRKVVDDVLHPTEWGYWMDYGSEEEEQEATELWPAVVKILERYGPMRSDLFGKHTAFRGHRMYRVMTRLSRRGLVTCEGEFYHETYALTDEAIKLLGIQSHAPKQSDEERIIMLLDDFEALGTGVLSRMLGRSTSFVRSRLYKLIDEGSVVAVGNGTSRKYRLAA